MVKIEFVLDIFLHIVRILWILRTAVYMILSCLQIGTMHQIGIFLLSLFTNISTWKKLILPLVFVKWQCFCLNWKKKTLLILGSNPNPPCKCDANDNVWRYEEGIINVKEIFPITNFIIRDTDGRKEKSYLTLGPLTCTGEFPSFFPEVLYQPLRL